MHLLLPPIAPAKINEIEVDPNRRKPRTGDIIKFKCKISGKPSLLMSWYKDGRTLTSSTGRGIFIRTMEDSSELEIESVQVSDQGSYTCVVRNEFGEHHRTVSLTVAKGTKVMFLL